MTRLGLLIVALIVAGGATAGCGATTVPLCIPNPPTQLCTHR